MTSHRPPCADPPAPMRRVSVRAQGILLSLLLAAGAAAADIGRNESDPSTPLHDGALEAVVGDTPVPGEIAAPIAAQPASATRAQRDADRLLRALIEQDIAVARILGRHASDEMAVQFARMVERNNARVLKLLTAHVRPMGEARGSAAEARVPPQCLQLPGTTWTLDDAAGIDAAELNRAFLARQHRKPDCYAAVLGDSGGDGLPEPALVAELTGMASRHRALAELVDARD